jgi:hypothetical protein
MTCPGQLDGFKGGADTAGITVTYLFDASGILTRMRAYKQN